MSARQKLMTLIVYFVGSALIIQIIGSITAMVLDKRIPTELATAIGMTLGYLGGFLTPSEDTSRPDTTVTRH